MNVVKAFRDMLESEDSKQTDQQYIERSTEHAYFANFEEFIGLPSDHTTG